MSPLPMDKDGIDDWHKRAYPHHYDINGNSLSFSEILKDKCSKSTWAVAHHCTDEKAFRLIVEGKQLRFTIFNRMAGDRDEGKHILKIVEETARNLQKEGIIGKDRFRLFKTVVNELKKSTFYHSYVITGSRVKCIPYVICFSFNPYKSEELKSKEVFVNFYDIKDRHSWNSKLMGKLLDDNRITAVRVIYGEKSIKEEMRRTLVNLQVSDDMETISRDVKDHIMNMRLGYKPLFGPPDGNGNRECYKDQNEIRLIYWMPIDDYLNREPYISLRRIQNDGNLINYTERNLFEKMKSKVFFKHNKHWIRVPKYIYLNLLEIDNYQFNIEVSESLFERKTELEDYVEKMGFKICIGKKKDWIDQ